MARHTKLVVIEAEGRDKGKVFKITEMDAMQAERWATRLLLGLAKSGVEIPDGIEEAGMAGVATLAIKAIGGINFADAEPLLDEMMTCVKIMPDPKHPDVERAWLKEDFEEVATLLQLRKEVFELHTNFSTLVARFKSEATNSVQQNS